MLDAARSPDKERRCAGGVLVAPNRLTYASGASVTARRNEPLRPVLRLTSTSAPAMSFTNIFSRLAGSLFGGPPIDPGDAIDPAMLDDAVDAIVDAVEPRIRVVPRYRKRLAPAATRTIRFMRSLAPALLAPIELSRAAWSADPYINAFFATVADVPAALGRSDELRVFFDAPANSQAEAAYALLAMRREERNVLAPALVDGEVRRDVAQTTAAFTGHVMFAIAAEPLVMRRLIGEAILERLAGLALERIVATRERAPSWTQGRACWPHACAC